MKLSNQLEILRENFNSMIITIFSWEMTENASDRRWTEEEWNGDDYRDQRSGSE